MDFLEQYEQFSDEEKQEVKNGYINILTEKVNDARELSNVLLKTSDKLESIVKRIEDGENPVEMMCIAGISWNHIITEVSRFIIKDNKEE